MPEVKFERANVVHRYQHFTAKTVVTGEDGSVTAAYVTPGGDVHAFNLKPESCLRHAAGLLQLSEAELAEALALLGADDERSDGGVIVPAGARTEP